MTHGEHGLRQTRPRRTVRRIIVTMRCPGGRQHVGEARAVFVGNVRDHLVDARDRVATEQPASDQLGCDGRGPAGRRIEVRCGRLAHGFGHHGVRVGVDELQRDGPGAGRGLVAIVVGQRGRGGGATVGRPRAPGAEPFPEIVEVEAPASHERLGQRQHHLAVVGEFARVPVEGPAANHLGGRAPTRRRETFGIGVRRAELEGSAEGVADHGTDEGADSALLGVGSDAAGDEGDGGGGVVGVVHGYPNDGVDRFCAHRLSTVHFAKCQWCHLI